MSRTKGTTRALWIALVLATSLLAMPAWSATVPKAKFAKNAGKLDGLDSTAFALGAHSHGGGDITSGTVGEPRIDPTITRDGEVLDRVLGGDGSGSGLDADLVDGVDTSTIAAPSTLPVMDAQGHLPNDSVDADTIVDPQQSIHIPVHELDEAFSSGTFPAKTLVGEAPALAFDASTDETVNFAVLVRRLGVGNTLLRLIWSASSTGNVRWEYSLRAVNFGESFTSEGFSTGSAQTVTNTSAGRYRSFTFLGFPTSNFQDSDLVIVRLWRDADHLDDTVAGDAHLHLIELNHQGSS